MTTRVIIFATTYFPLVGGAEIAMKELTDRLSDWTFDLFCARLKRELARTERIGNVTVHRCGFGAPFDKYLLPVLGAWKAFWMRGSRASIIWSLMASYGGFAALVYTWLRPHSKLLLTLQEGDPLEHYAQRTGCFSFLHKKLFVRANAVQAISRFLGRWAQEMGFFGAPEIIPNGVDFQRFARALQPEERTAIRQAFGWSDDDTILVTASRLSLKNGIDDFLRSLLLLPESYKALIIGAGEDREKLRALTTELGLTFRVRFAGHCDHQEIPRLLQASDVFVRASLSEGLGSAFLEAMACGIPIVGTSVGGIPDFLRDGETGVFCNPRDPHSIAAAVRRIVEYPELRAKLARQGEALVRERYDWNDVAARMNTILKKLAVV